MMESQQGQKTEAIREFLKGKSKEKYVFKRIFSGNLVFYIQISAE